MIKDTMITDAYTLGKILEWLQRLIVLYTLGEDELPSEFKTLLNMNRSKNGIHEFDKCLLKGDISNVIESYEFRISSPNNNVFSFDTFISNQQQTFSARFIITNDDTCDVHIRNGIVTIIIGKDILNVTNAKKSIQELDRIIANDLCYLVDFPYFVIKGINSDRLCCGIVSYYFIKSVFTNVDWSIMTDKNDLSTIIAKEFVVKNTHNMGSYSDLISKLINEDDDVWGFIANSMSPFKSGFDEYSESK